MRELWTKWQVDVLEWMRNDGPKVAGAIIEAVVLIALLRLATGRLRDFSQRETLPTGIRGQQLRTLASVLNSVGTVIIVFLAAMQALSALRINIGPLLASAGIAGLAIGFGAQTLVKDVINGFFILLENQYDIGDTVRVAGVRGTVEGMTLRRTTLRDEDGALHVVPNSEIKVVSNLTRDWTQVALHIAVAYDENSDRVISLLRQVGSELKNDPSFADALVADPQVPGIERVSGGEVDYLMLVKTRPRDRFLVSRELRRRIKECFDQNNIQPARPAQFVVAEPASPPPPKS